jgi:hypothetical protein
MRALLRKLYDYLFTPRFKERPTRSRKKERHTDGVWYYFSDLLDQLDDYFAYMPKFRAREREAYIWYGRLGAPIVSAQHRFEDKLPPSWKDTSKRPAWGFVHYKPKELDGKWCTHRFAFFQKLNNPMGVQLTNFDTYRMGMFYGQIKSGHTQMAEIYVAVDNDGEIHLLNNLVTRYKGKNRDIPVRCWEKPKVLNSILKDNGRKPSDSEREAAAREVFLDIAVSSASSQKGMQVRVTKGPVTALFAIDAERTPYFFKDRDKVVTEGGRAKKIIHQVRVHERKLKSGRTTFVRSHFRGIRRFNWHGYGVVVSMPGWHHPYYDDFPLAGTVGKIRGMKDKFRTVNDVAKGIQQRWG